MIVWDWLSLVVGILLILIVLLQKGDDDIQDAFSGEKSELLKGKTTSTEERTLALITTTLSVLFILFVILSNVAERIIL